MKRPLRTVVRVLALLHTLVWAPLVGDGVEAVLGAWEQVVKALVAHSFVEVVRFLSGLSAAVVSLYQPGHKATLRSVWGKPDATPQTGITREARPSTLNAIVEGLYPRRSSSQHNRSSSQQSKGDHALPAANIISESAALSHGQSAPSAPPHHLSSDSWLLQPSGAGVIVLQRGHLHDVHMLVESAVSRVFAVCRRVLRTVLLLPQLPPAAAVASGPSPRTLGVKTKPSQAPGPLPPLPVPQQQQQQQRPWWQVWPRWLPGPRTALKQVRTHVPKASHFPRSHSMHAQLSSRGRTAAPLTAALSPVKNGLRRVQSFSATEAMCQHISEVSSTGDVVRLAGYPFEVHDVTTADGYIISLERIPRYGSPNVIFFMHGMLDTTMSWVSGGITGSQGFALWEAGYDVWLGSNRSCAPRRHKDPAKRGAAYFLYNNNHVAILDVGAQLDHIHEVKCAELGVVDLGMAGTKSMAGARSMASSRRRNMQAASEDGSGQPHQHVRPASEDKPRPLGRASVALGGQQHCAPLLHPLGGASAPNDADAAAAAAFQHDTNSRRTWATILPAPQLQRQSNGQHEQTGLRPSSSEGNMAPQHIQPQPPPLRHLGHSDTVPVWRLDAHNQATAGTPLQSPNASTAVKKTPASTPDKVVGSQSSARSPSSVSEDSSCEGSAHFQQQAQQAPNAYSLKAAAAISSQGMEPGPVELEQHGSGRSPAPQRWRWSVFPRSRSDQDVKVQEGGSIGTGPAQQQLPVLPAPQQPYKLRAVGHSLGGMALIIHCVIRGKQAIAQGISPTAASHVSRLVLLTPAGFHNELPLAATVVGIVVPPFLRLMKLLWPGFAMPFYIPSTTVRNVVFKLLRDVSAIPSMQELVSALTRIALNNDASQWERAMQMPHYNAKDMPAMSLHQMLHLTQIAKASRFQLFDYGSRAANYEAYGTGRPLDIAADYACLRGMPVDLVAGLRDGVIPPSNVRTHYAKMKEAGVKVSYREFDFGHLDFTFATRDELQLYMAKILRQK